MHKIIFSFLYFISTASAVRTPKITNVSPDQEVDVGSSAELECSVQYAQQFPVLWMKKGPHSTFPLSTDSSLIIRDSRYSLRHDTGSSTYILQIKDLQPYDGGVYMCQVIIDLTSRISETVHLQVRQPPIIFDNSSRTVVVPSGTPVKLECYADGAPTPKITWRRENNALLPTGGSVFSGSHLTIPSIKKEDRGTYYCIASNGVGRGDRRNINVEVEFEPTVIALKPRVQQAQTFDAILECRVESYPPADISWIFRAETIVKSNKYGISQFDTDEEFTDSVMTVLGIEGRQYGTYTCRAHNRLGWAKAEIILEETYSPVCPPACEMPYTYGSATSCSFSFMLFIACIILALT